MTEEKVEKVSTREFEVIFDKMQNKDLTEDQRDLLREDFIKAIDVEIEHLKKYPCF